MGLRALHQISVILPIARSSLKIFVFLWSSNSGLIASNPIPANSSCGVVNYYFVIKPNKYIEYPVEIGYKKLMYKYVSDIKFCD